MRLIIYQGVRGGWYWRFIAGNNRTIAIGGELFSSKANALRAFKAMKSAVTRFGFYGIEHKGDVIKRNGRWVKVRPGRKTQRRRRR